MLQTKQRFSITASAFTQARQKLKYAAFVELNNKIVSMYYDTKTCKKLHGYRILGVDASIIILPNTLEMKTEFGYRVPQAKADIILNNDSDLVMNLQKTDSNQA